jgi:hypothetical protein
LHVNNNDSDGDRRDSDLFGELIGVMAFFRRSASHAAKMRPENAGILTIVMTGRSSDRGAQSA